MNVLIVGSGGREHAMAWKISQSKLVDKIYAAPGNAGMSTIADIVDIKADDIEALLSFASDKNIDLTVVGPEAPLVAGIADRFEDRGLLIFGPSEAAARLEGSKIFSKELMKKSGVPTADFEVFDNSKDASEYILAKEPPYVIKADGLAAGKGVIIAKSSAEAVDAVKDILDNGKFGDAGKKIIIEECLSGEELSVLAFTDGDKIIPLASSQDHKRAYDNDEGPNTGGMGAYSPCPLVLQSDIGVIVEQTITPVIKELKNNGIVYKGLIYAGLMITENGPMVLEYNVRFGDPETQAVLPRMKSDIVTLFLETAKGKIETTDLAWDHRAAVAVVVASEGYPGSYEKYKEIKIADSFDDDIFIFHAGTAVKDGKLVVNGGRILAVTALGENLKDAVEKVYVNLPKIEIEKSFYRKDIGVRGLK